MTAPPPPTNLRLPAELLERADTLTARLSARSEWQAMKLTRSSLLKAAIDRGLTALAADWIRSSLLRRKPRLA